MKDTTQINNHAEFELVNGHGDAVLFVHGILGSPCQFRLLAEELNKRGFNCRALLLPGHGGTAEQFYRTSPAKWPGYVDEAIRTARSRYQRVFVVGHSLGGLLCLDAATKHDVAEIVLLNTPLSFKISLRQLAFSMKVLFSPKGKDDEFLSVYRQAYSISSGRIYEYPLMLRQFVGLISYAGRVKRMLHLVTAKTLIFQSARDESVGRKSVVRLMDGLVNAQPKLIWLRNSFHGYFPGDDKDKLLSEICQFISQ